MGYGADSVVNNEIPTGRVTEAGLVEMNQSRGNARL